MPCSDPHAESDRLTANRHHNHHNAIDKHLANGVSKWDDRLMSLHKMCNEILEEAYKELCVD